MDVYLCPKCGKRAEICVAPNFIPISWGITMERLDLPYFVCVPCNLVGIDWQLIRKCLSSLYQRRLNKKRRCFRKLYDEIRKSMEVIIDWRKKIIGNQETKFKKQLH